MTWSWFAVLDEHRDDPTTALAAAKGQDRVSGHTVLMAAWPSGRKPVRQAVRVDSRVIDPEGAPATVSLVLIPAVDSPLFDDPAVSAALRGVLEAPPVDAVSTFVRDSSHFAGAVTVLREAVHRLRDDPFARLWPARIIDVEGGLFGCAPTPVGPVTQRYSGQPWPVSGF